MGAGFSLEEAGGKRGPLQHGTVEPWTVELSLRADRTVEVVYYPYLCSMSPNLKPVFNKRIFWDVVFEDMDYDAKANFVIERVFERGDVPDIRNCRRYYGDDKVRETLLRAKFLPVTRMYLASAVIDRPLSDFRCYILRQSNPALFPY